MHYEFDVLLHVSLYFKLDIPLRTSFNKLCFFYYNNKNVLPTELCVTKKTKGQKIVKIYNNMFTKETKSRA